MQNAQHSVFDRSDTFFGVCEAIGEDFGFNPLYLRVALGVLLLWNPVLVFGAYASLGLVVALSRLVFPNPRPARAGTHADADIVTLKPDPQNCAGHADPEMLAIAA